MPTRNYKRNSVKKHSKTRGKCNDAHENKEAREMTWMLRQWRKHEKMTTLRDALAGTLPKTTVSDFKKKCGFHIKYPCCGLLWLVLRVFPDYVICCGDSTLWIKLDLLSARTTACRSLLSLWFKVCTCPKPIEWQIRFFPSKSIVKGGPLSFSLSEEALKFDRILT